MTSTVLLMLLAGAAHADQATTAASDKNSEARFILETLSYTAKLARERWRNRGKPRTHNPEDDNNPNDVGYGYPKDKPIAIDGKLLGSCLSLATRPPYVLDKSKMKCRSLSLGSATKLHASFFDYLRAKRHRDCDFVSGNEEELIFWVLEQPDNSIDPVTIYQKSLEINGGNIWNALLTIHQILRNSARWMLADRYDYDFSPQKQRKFFDKFIDLRGALEQRGPGFHGDHFGSWYRLWGAMLYRLDLLGEQTFKDGVAHADLSCSEFAVRVEGVPGVLSRRAHALIDDWHSSAVFYADESLKLYLERNEEDAGKFSVDKAGGLGGSWLVRGVWDPARARDKGLTLEKCLSDRPYLKPR